MENLRSAAAPVFRHTKQKMTARSESLRSPLRIVQDAEDLDHFYFDATHDT